MNEYEQAKLFLLNELKRIPTVQEIEEFIEFHAQDSLWWLNSSNEESN